MNKSTQLTMLLIAASILNFRKMAAASGMLLLVLAISINVTAAQKEVEPLTVIQHICSTSGSGNTYLKVCISKEGNVMLLESPQGNTLLDASREGYDISVGCKNYYDFGVAGNSGNWQPATQSGTGLPLTITRLTSDGKFKLVQTFSRNITERELSINMTVTNTSGQSQATFLRRYADFDTNEIEDVYDRTARSFNVHSPINNQGPTSIQGALLTSVSPAATQTSVFQWPISISATQCITGTLLATPTPPGDGLGLMIYNLGTMANNTNKSITIKYQNY